MKKRIVSTLILVVSAFLSNAQTIGIQHDNAPNPDYVTPCSSQTYELTNVSAYLATLPAGWKVCSVDWEDGGYHVLQTTTGTKVTLTVSSNFTLMAYVTLGDANCSQQTHTTSSTIAVNLIPMALNTPVASMPVSGCTQAFPASTSFVNDGSHYLPTAGSYSVAWSTPAGWSYSPAALSTNITPDANGTGNISATVTLNGCPYSVTSPALAITRTASALTLSSSNPQTACGTSQTYAVNSVCGASSYTYTITGNSGCLFSNGLQTLTTPSTSVNISFPSTGGSFVLWAQANFPNGSSTSSVNAAYYFGVPQMVLSINKIVGTTFFATATHYVGATYTWTLDTHSFSAVDADFYDEDVTCGVAHHLSVYAVTPCGTTNTASRIINIACGGGGGSKALKVNASPNPTQGMLKVSFGSDEQTSALAGKTKLIKAARIIDKAGRILRRYEFGTGVPEVSINTSGLATDIYVLQVFDGIRWVHQEIIVK